MIRIVRRDRCWRGMAGFGAGASRLAAAILLEVGFGLLSLPGPAAAASSDACAGGGFRVVVPNQTLTTSGTIAAANLPAPARIQIVGKYVQFSIVPQTFGIENWLFTGAANPRDITGGRRTLVWERKTPDHRGLVLNGAAAVELDEEELVITRSGPGVSMKIQAKDCAQGGIFQMEPERGDGTATRITHLLAPGTFYFDNPRFRAREGQVVPYKDTTVTVTARINVANDISAKLVGRDSPQVATRVQEPTCSNRIQTLTGFTTVQHCGRLSRWDVASGGRMGWVTGEDSVEVAPPATTCTHKCRAQNRVRGQAVVLGFPSPVPAASRLQPPLP
jgi:hypothetical protein